MNLHIFMEQVENKGEDRGVSGDHYAFVFDGLGGSGARKRTNRQGETKTEAQIASHAAARRMETLMAEKWASWAQGLDYSGKDALLAGLTRLVREEIKPEMMQALREAAQEYNGLDASAAFPTTMAGWITFPLPDGKTLAVAVWAGDSRCYILDAEHMMQATRDTTYDYLDPMQELSTDCRLKSLLRLNEDFEIEIHAYSLDRPSLLMCCTDGFYRGFQSPMHLEYDFRSVFSQGNTAEEMQAVWQEYFLTPQIPGQPESNFLHDDSATMEAVWPGDAEALRETLLAPLAALEEKYIAPLMDFVDEAEEDVERKIVKITFELKEKEDRFHFYRDLEANIARYVRGEVGYPAELPCSELVAEMRREYMGMLQANRDKEEATRKQLREAVQEAQRSLDAQLEATKKTVVNFSEWAHAPSANVQSVFQPDMKIVSPYQLEKIKALYPDILEYLRGQIGQLLQAGGFVPTYQPNQKYGKSGASDAVDKNKAFTDLEQAAVDLIFVINRVVGITMPGKEMTRVTARNRRLEKFDQALTPQEARRLKQQVLAWARGENLPPAQWDAVLDPPASGCVIRTLNPADVIRLIEIAMTLRDAENAEQQYPGESNEEPEKKLAALLPPAFEKYKLRKPKADAKFIVTEWYQTGRQPAYFRMEQPLEKVLAEGVERLRGLQRRNERIRQRRNERDMQLLHLWEIYRGAYEAWKKPFDYVAPPVPPTELPRTEPAPEAAQPAPEAASDAQPPAAQTAEETPADENPSDASDTETAAEGEAPQDAEPADADASPAPEDADTDAAAAEEPAVLEDADAEAASTDESPTPADTDAEAASTDEPPAPADTDAEAASADEVPAVYDPEAAPELAAPQDAEAASTDKAPAPADTDAASADDPPAPADTDAASADQGPAVASQAAQGETGASAPAEDAPDEEASLE